jgi:CRISPR-associated protein Cas1
VFDMMEPERPNADRAVLAFLKSQALHPADFTIREDGVVRLNPELARHLASLTYCKHQPRANEDPKAPDF